MKRGFTLIELLVVVLIIGILSAVALPQYTKAVHKARFTENLTRLKTFEQTLDLYLLENGGFPSSEVDLTELYPDIVAGLEKGDDGYYYSKYGRYSLYCDGDLLSWPCRAIAFYEKLGFSTIKHERYPVENGVILAYEVMEKELYQISSAICFA